MPFSLENKIIFVLSPERWGIMKLSKHHYASELAARGNTVYFIEPPDLTAKGVSIDAVEGCPSLFLVKYKPIYRGERFLPGMLYGMLIRMQVRRLLKHIGVTPDIVWCFQPFLFRDLRWFGAKVNVFHMMDLSSKTEVPPEAATADLCFGVTDSIIKYLQPAGRPSYFINHGLSRQFITESLSTRSLSKGPVDGQPVTVGYIGNMLMQAIDRDTMIRVIREHPGVRFIFWGQYKIGQDKLGAFNFPETHRFIKDLQDAPNVVLRGPVTPDILSTEIKSVDAFWLCYKKGTGSNLWEGSNSHKLLEYLINGKPVITHKVETYEGYPDILYMVEDMHNENYPDLFDRIISDLGHYSEESLQRKRTEMALANSYENHIRFIEKKIAETGLYK